jgi:signal transduction histidine kinase
LSKASLRFSSAILRRLGEELNPNADQGILELAKNSYDADARQCTVELENVSKAGGTIRISDNGDSMTDVELIDGFLVLGQSKKSSTSRTRLGRIPVGNKGLGRLAALRLGRKVSVRARPRSDPRAQYHLAIDWDRYDRASLVEDVDLEIVKRTRPKRMRSGTVIEVSGLRRKLTRGDVKRLARSLILLADPFGEDVAGFKPQLRSPEFADLAKLVENSYFADADFHLIAEVDGAGNATASVVDWRGERLFEGGHADIARRRKNQAPYDIPPTRFDLWIFILSREAFLTRNATLTEVREWLKTFGGVHLYINRLRVSPYGNPGEDWLEMNARRAASPEERPSTNTAVGRIAVLDEGEALVQKTDRSGLIENDAFEDLRAFGVDSMDWLARRRLDVAERRRAAERKRSEQATQRSRSGVRAQIAKAPTQLRAPLEDAFNRYDESRQAEANQLRKEVQLYRTLSTAGITAATFAHETASNPLKVISQSAMTIERRGKLALDGDYNRLLGRSVSRLRRATESLGVLSSVTLNLVDRERRRPSRVQLHEVFDHVVRTFQPFFNGRDIEVATRYADGEPFLRGTAAAIESILTNLLNNAVSALEDAKVPQRRIEVRTEIIGDEVLILSVLDNGPGIDTDQIDLDDIWLPGETTHSTGLGLTIVRDAVADLGGEVDVEAQGELGGAEFMITLPLLGA